MYKYIKLIFTAQMSFSLLYCSNNLGYNRLLVIRKELFLILTTTVYVVYFYKTCSLHEYKEQCI